MGSEITVNVRGLVKRMCEHGRWHTSATSTANEPRAWWGHVCDGCCYVWGLDREEQER